MSFWGYFSAIVTGLLVGGVILYGLVWLDEKHGHGDHKDM